MNKARRRCASAQAGALRPSAGRSCWTGPALSLWPDRPASASPRRPSGRYVPSGHACRWPWHNRQCRGNSSLERRGTRALRNPRCLARPDIAQDDVAACRRRAFDFGVAVPVVCGNELCLSNFCGGRVRQRGRRPDRGGPADRKAVGCGSSTSGFVGGTASAASRGERAGKDDEATIDSAVHDHSPLTS